MSLSNNSYKKSTRRRPSPSQRPPVLEPGINATYSHVNSNNVVEPSSSNSCYLYNSKYKYKAAKLKEQYELFGGQGGLQNGGIGNEQTGFQMSG